ncbi:sensor histidine kinase [Extensimonas vulgaris]|uniref:Two-component system sensor histidine kinase AlgZ n=1 Tax=Extensimonas vulgaris TaxID=1031594 RepID=A0A369APX6_9BURK|nr:two-component system sensor histidine kinase AlgZ [Extensimonas vulgaris]TWI39834.1 two-component system sensor histidine kinase AlgZ [Extensimonas vulgaris]TXD17399.1 sensor histidine kinase [Extensimonas vulgaris]
MLESSAAIPKPATARGTSAHAAVLVFDACEVGLVLRAVLFVEAVLGVGALFGAGSAREWLLRLMLLTGGALPATLAWLLTACSLKKTLQRLSTARQYAAGVLLGALAGLMACAMLALAGVATAPPWLASAASGALLAALLVAALVLRARGRTPAATAARLAELQARIRPHFLFNTLNSAIALVRAEPAKAEALLEDLSELFRHALAEQGESVTLAEELRLARHYLDVEAVRFGPRLQVQWQLDPRADAARLPPLLLQPLVENAIQHGVEPSPRGGKLRVQTELRGSRVRVRITNTLPAPGSEAPAAQRRGHGMALANVRARLALLHDLQANFSAGVQDGLYEVCITLPAPRQPLRQPRPAPRRAPTPTPTPTPTPEATPPPSREQSHAHPDR